MPKKQTQEVTEVNCEACPCCTLESFMDEFEKIPTLAAQMKALQHACLGTYSTEIWTAHQLLGLMVDTAHKYLAHVGEPVTVDGKGKARLKVAA